MNIFELTRILNEASKIAQEVSNDILEYDNAIENSNPSNPEAKSKKTLFFKKIKNIIDDEVNENSVRNIMFNTLKRNDFIRGKKTLQTTISAIKNILHQANDKTLNQLLDKISSNIQLKQRGSVINDLGLGNGIKNLIYKLKNFVPYGCGPWEAFFGLVYNAKKAKTKGDIIINETIYEVKLSNSGYIDNKTVNAEYEKLVMQGFVGDEKLKKLEIYLELKNRQRKNAQILIVDGIGNYIVINSNNYMELYNNKTITLNYKSKGEGTDFGVLSICYNVK